MNLLRSIHETAMEYSVMAGVAKAKGFDEHSKAAYRVAFDLEKEAATKTPGDADELSRLLLFRSAAALAFRAGLFQECEQLLERCRAENPPRWMQIELIEIENLLRQTSAKQANGRGKALQVEGILADVNTRQNEIIVEDPADSRSFSIIAPRNLLADIFKNYWSKRVSVLTRQTPHGVMVLENIAAAA